MRPSSPWRFVTVSPSVSKTFAANASTIAVSCHLSTCRCRTTSAVPGAPEPVGWAIDNKAGATVYLEGSEIRAKFPVTNRGSFTAVESTIVARGMTNLGMDNLAGGTMTLRDTSVNLNEAEFMNDGMATLARATVSNYSYDSAGTVNNGVMMVRESTFRGNLDGGAIDNRGELSVVDSLFIENISYERGGAISNSGTLSVMDTAFVRNRAEDTGGAIYNTGFVTLGGVTFTENRPNDCTGCE